MDKQLEQKPVAPEIPVQEQPIQNNLCYIVNFNELIEYLKKII